MDRMFVYIFTVFAPFCPVLPELGMHSGLHVCMHIHCVCALLAVIECMFAVFAFFWLVLEELGMHSALHVCIHIYGVCAVFVCPGRAWNS